MHGLSDAFLAEAPVFADIAADFLAFTQGAELIAHNAVFDVGFVNNELSIAGFPSLEENGCTALCGIDDSRRVKHGALLDAELLAEVTKKLLTRGA